MTNAQKVGGLAMMTVFLGLLIFVRTMWESGRLTYALLGLVVAIIILGLAIAYWRNAEAVLDFFRAIPGWVGGFLGEYWAHLIGLALVVGMFWVGGGMLWKAAKVAVGHESAATTPIASPTASTPPAAADTIRRTIIATSDGWSPQVMFPTGYTVDITPRSACAYAVLASDGQITEVPAVAPTPDYQAEFKGPLDRMRVKTVDGGVTCTFDITATR